MMMTLSASFNAAATQEIADGVTRSVTYTNISQQPTAKVLLKWTVNDHDPAGAKTSTAIQTINITDDIHHFRNIRLVAALIDDGEIGADALGSGAGAGDAADVRRNDHQLVGVVVLLDVADHDGRAIEIVGRNVEEALDLAGMQVEREDAVGAGMGDQVGDKLGRDGRAGLGLAAVGEHHFDVVGADRDGRQDNGVPIDEPYVKGTTTDFDKVHVPQGMYFVLGDNRDNSADSRVYSFIPRDQIIGRSSSVVFSLDAERNYFPRPDRFLEGLQ